MVLVSDGAGVMMGKRSGTAVRLENELGKKLTKVWCSAHRLEIALERSFEGPKSKKGAGGVPGHADFEKLINNIYTFYGYN